MRLLNRFWNWLCSAFSVVLRFLRQLARRDSSFEDEQIAERQQVNEAAGDVTLADSVPTVPSQPSNQQPEVVEPHGSVAAQVEKISPVEAAITSVKPQASVNVTVERRGGSSAECRKVIAPPAQVSTADQLVAGEPSAVHQPAASPTASAENNPESGNGRALDRRRANGRYSPGEASDQTAQRLARLLISEIKLYNKTASEASGNNLYDALKEPIDKARKYYGQRLGTTVVDSMPDYFHAELVRGLCAGDPSRLGPNYTTTGQN